MLWLVFREMSQFPFSVNIGEWRRQPRFMMVYRSRGTVSTTLNRCSHHYLPLFSIQGSRDNMSVVLVCFPNTPKISEEAVKKEAELDKFLGSRVEGERTPLSYNSAVF